MKIFIDRFCLSEGDGESPRSLSIHGQQAVQSVQPLHGGTVDVYPRGARINTVEFTVTREHASHAAAEGFLFRHAAELPREGHIAFLCEDVDGETIRYTAEASVVTSDRGAQLALTTTHQYTIACGPISGGEPPRK